jgi:hypothetical protein
MFVIVSKFILSKRNATSEKVQTNRGVLSIFYYFILCPVHYLFKEERIITNIIIRLINGQLATLL